MLSQQTLDSAIVAPPERPEVVRLGPTAKSDLRRKILDLTREVSELDSSLLVSATYDGERRVAVLKFYDPSKDRIYLWSDKSGHKPHAFSKTPAQELEYLKKERDNIIGIETVEKYEPLTDKMISVSKIIARDPLAIGGQDASLRNKLTLWEADIKYYENFLYDNGLLVGTFYKIREGRLDPVPFETPREVQDSLKNALASAKPELASAIEDWASLLNQPLVNLKRAALDIEVLSIENRIPNSQEATQPVVAASIVSKNLKRVYLLLREDIELGRRNLPDDAEVLFFDTEKDLIISLFNDMLDYPFIATFNGDDFDLDYLYHRAQRPEIGLVREEIPIQLGNKFAGTKHGVHIDLYRTFNNKSLQVYAFGNKYSDKTLNGIAEALLGKSKIDFDGEIGDLPLYELARYNLWDAILTFELASVYNDVLMKLLIVIARVGKMPIDDLSRLGVSNWIRSMLYFEHRRINALIPRPEDLEAKGGARSEAVIKGKKYKGGLVIDPKTGVHFNVSVLDFASLYPSLIKVYNISYETVNCSHQECKTNVIPELGTWRCKIRRGIESLVVGSLRDLRVDYYKQLTRSKTLSREDLDLYKVVSQGLKVILNACFTGDTEILTTSGIKNIKEVRPGDYVVSVNPETLVPEIDEIVQTQEFPYNDDIYSFKNGKQIDLRVTKNHRLFVKKGKRKATFLEAREIEKWTNISIPRVNAPAVEEDRSVISLAEYRGMDRFVIEIPITKVICQPLDSQFPELWKYASTLGYYDKQSRSFICDRLSKLQMEKIKSLGGVVSLTSGHSRYPFEFNTTDFAELCGWIISEIHIGSTVENFYLNGNHRGRDFRILTTQTYGLHGNVRGNLFRQDIIKLLDRMALRFKAYKNGFRIANPALYRFCLEQIGKGACNKRIPAIILESSLNAKKRLMLSLIRGDGSLRDSKYTTTSETLAGQFCSLLAQLGYRPRKYADKIGKGIYRIVWHNSSIGLTESGNAKLKWITKEKLEGQVYCVTTRKNHTVFAGRNGIFVPVGQSYGVLGFESFPLYCLPAAEAVATLGRYAITKTIEKCKELGIDVIYSDTDSLFLESPSEKQTDEVSAWTLKELGIELEVDKTYRYVAMSERKKNYFGVLSDGTVDLKGLTGKKSQTPQFIKDSFYEILNILSRIKTRDDFEDARSAIVTRLKSDYAKLKEKQISMDDLAFNVVISKDVSRYKETIPQHVRAAQLLQKNGKEVKAGDIISFVKTTTGEGAKPVSIARKDEIDVEKYLEYMRNTFDQILGSLGYDFDEILGARKLEDFFWTS